ncbi:MAG: hypothetical protein ACLUVG_23275 [Phocaeicola vulgatus]
MSDGDIIKLIVHFTINYHDVVLKVAGKHGEEEGRNIEWATVMGET